MDTKQKGNGYHGQCEQTSSYLHGDHVATRRKSKRFLKSFKNGQWTSFKKQILIIRVPKMCAQCKTVPDHSGAKEIQRGPHLSQKTRLLGLLYSFHISESWSVGLPWATSTLQTCFASRFRQQTERVMPLHICMCHMRFCQNLR